MFAYTHNIKRNANFIYMFYYGWHDDVDFHDLKNGKTEYKEYVEANEITPAVLTRIIIEVD